MAEQQLISTALKQQQQQQQQQQQLGADDEREKFATEGTTLSPLTVEFQKGDASTTSTPTDAERAQQVRFTLLLLGSSTLAAIALNLESIYVGHIEGDEDNGTAQMAAYHIGEIFCGLFYIEEFLWAGVLAQIGSALGANDDQRIEKLMRMSMVSAVYCGASAWCIAFPFAGPIIKVRNVSPCLCGVPASFSGCADWQVSLPATDAVCSGHGGVVVLPAVRSCSHVWQLCDVPT